MHAGAAVSDWVARWAGLLAPGARVLDVACGSGRHVRRLQARGCTVTALDRDADALAPLAAIAEIVVADIEAGPWPLPGRRFDAVVVTNYLHRPLADTLLAAVGVGGLYLHETFADGQQAYGRPSRADFLLRPGELLAVAGRRADLAIVAYEDGLLPAPTRRVQRIVARAGGAGAARLAGG